MNFKYIVGEIFFVIIVSTIVLLGNMFYDLGFDKSMNISLFLLINLILFSIWLGIKKLNLDKDKSFWNTYLNELKAKKYSYVLYFLIFLLVSITSYFAFNGRFEISSYLKTILIILIMYFIFMIVRELILNSKSQVFAWIFTTIFGLICIFTTFVSITVMCDSNAGLGGFIVYLTIPIAIISGLITYKGIDKIRKNKLLLKEDT